MPLDRRRFLRLAAAAAAVGAWRPGALLAKPSTDRYPFALGVASGCGQASGVVLWTRIVPDAGDRIAELAGLPLEAYIALRDRRAQEHRPALDVRWEIATDERFRRIVKRGTARALPELAHSVHVEVNDLNPGRWYWYRFLAGDAESPIGRVRTAETADTGLDRLRFAFASCQHYEYGHFGAYRHMLEDQPDLVVFLGDYIYEGGPRQNRMRPHPFPSARMLEDYRLRHALYKLDPDLQRIHAACPWLMTWDDHEVSNDYAGDRGEILTIDGAARREAAYQAYYEHMPLPASVLAQRFGALQIHREVSFGRLASFVVLDDRQYRDPQACQRPERGGSSVVDDAACAERNDKRRTLLGLEQERWFAQRMARSSARWTLIAQQTLMAQLNREPAPQRRFWTDGWDGYPAARERLLAAIQQHRPRNPVVIGGDVHANWVCDLKRDFDQPASPTLATEFCGTSITSVSNWTQARAERVASYNPHVRFTNVEKRGYAIAELTAKGMQVDLRVVDDVSKPQPAVSTLASFVVEDGRPGAQRLAER